MTNTSNQHIYERSIDQNSNDSLGMLARLVNNNSVCLDLGCGTGALGRFLVKNKQCVFDGLTYNQQEADIAKENYRTVKVDDLDTTNLLSIFPQGHYDYIICADVLEHLKQPEKILELAKLLLKPNGALLISIPNAAYAGLVMELMQGNFTYREEGLLDRTHLRFFTRQSLKDLLSQHGWHIHSLDTVHMPTCDSEFNTEFEKLPPAVASHLLACPDALSYQFIASAKLTPTDQPKETIPADNFASFATHIYLGQNGQFDEQHKISSRGAIGKSQQWVEFTLPANMQDFDGIRLDPADRPGYLHLYQIELLSAEQQLLWKWSANAGALGGLHNDLLCSKYCGSDGFQRFLMHGNDPWIALDIPPNILEKSHGGILKVAMDWPFSADYMELGKEVSFFKKTQADHISDLESKIKQQQENEKLLQAKISALSESLQYHQSQLSHLLQRSQSYFNPNNTEIDANKNENQFSQIHAIYDEVEKRILMRIAKKLYK